MADEHFEVRAQAKTVGMILAERKRNPWGGFLRDESGAAIGIWIDPFAPGAAQYVVEVVAVNRRCGSRAEQP